MKWRKRDCPIRMEIVPYGAGWEDVTFIVGGHEHWWSVAGESADGVCALAESLYALYPHQVHCGRERDARVSENEYYVGEVVNGEYVKLERLDEEPEFGSYMIIPKTVEFYWDHGPWGVRWKLMRESEVARDFDLRIELEEVDDERKTRFEYKVRYSDLCYAVGKAITAAVKSHGFSGFQLSTWDRDISLRHLCFLKACGMGVPDSIQPFESAEKGEGAVSSFADEIELLMFDM